MTTLVVVSVSACVRVPATAEELLERVVTAAGGAERLASVATWEIAGRGRENLGAEAQGSSSREPTWRDHQERLAVEAASLSVAWQRRTPRNDNSLRWRRMILGGEQSGMIDLASGRGMMMAMASDESRRRGLARRVPHLLLLEAATQARSVESAGERRLDGARHDAVAVELRDGARLTLVLGRDPAVLRRVEFQTHLPTRGDVTVAWQWDGWTADEDLGFRPAGHRVTVGQDLFQEVAYDTYAANTDVDALFSVADTTSGQRPPRRSPAPTAGLPATGAVAPGVHIGNISGFVVILVEFPDFVLVAEAPEAHPGLEQIPAPHSGTTVSDAHLAWVRETAGSKPIRYVVVSHHHSDHMGGIRTFAEAGATILVPEDDVEAARRTLSSPHTIASPEAGEDMARDGAVEGVVERRSIEGAGRRVELINVGPNPHTDANLLVWLPNERIAFQGDLFYYSDGAPFPPAGRETMNEFFAEWLNRNEIAPLAIYGVHGNGAAGARALELVPSSDGS